MSDGIQKYTPKTFWQKPDGTTAKFVMPVLIGLGGYAFYKALPFILTLLVDGITAFALGATLFTLIMFALNGRVQAVVRSMFLAVIRGMTNWWTETNPIAVAEGHVEDLEKEVGTMDKHMGNLNDAISKMRGKVSRNAKGIEENQQKALLAKRELQGTKDEDQAADYQEAIFLSVQQAGRLEKSNMSLGQLLAKLEGMHRFLKKLRRTANTTLLNLKNEVSVKKDEYLGMQEGYSAFKSALGIFKGNPDRREMFEKAMDVMNDTVAMQVGEIREFMETSRGFLTSIDLDQMIIDENAMKKLDEYERKMSGGALMLGTGEERTVIPTAQLIEREKIAVGHEINDLDDLFSGGKK